jgi:hypothetical protein
MAPRYRGVKRLLLALSLAACASIAPLNVLAEDQPFRTVIDSIVPKVNGLTIEGGNGGCDLVLQNQTGQDVILFDLSKPAKPFRFAAQAKGASPRPPIPVHLAGAWPCASLPAVTEDERWNHAQTTVGSWSINGAVGAVSFKLRGRSLYDPALDPTSDLMLYARLGAGLLAAGGLILATPYLFRRRREILGVRKAA